MKDMWQKHGLPFDTGSPPMAMDCRHVLALYTALLKARPRVAVEIGSYMGHSTVAFLSATASLPEMQVHLFEPYPTPELLRLIADAPQITLHRSPIWGSDLHPDFAFIDGDHGVPALADLAFCLARDVRVIAMHDSNGHTCGLTPEGSEMAANLLKAMPDRRFTEDCEYRKGEWTQRGFLISTKR